MIDAGIKTVGPWSLSLLPLFSHFDFISWSTSPKWEFHTFVGVDYGVKMCSPLPSSSLENPGIITNLLFGPRQANGGRWEFDVLFSEERDRSAKHTHVKIRSCFSYQTFDFLWLPVVNLRGNLLDIKINVLAMVIDVCCFFLQFYQNLSRSQIRIKCASNPHFLSIDLPMIKASHIPSGLPERCQFRNIGQILTLPQFHFQLKEETRKEDISFHGHVVFRKSGYIHHTPHVDATLSGHQRCVTPKNCCKKGSLEFRSLDIC